MTRTPYDANWRKLRLHVLRKAGYQCYVPGCTTPADNVDHIVPVGEAPGLRLVETNLRASCPAHNYGRSSKRNAEIVAKLNQPPAAVRLW